LRAVATKQARRTEKALADNVEETTTVFNGRVVPILKLKDEPKVESLTEEGPTKEFLRD
jgi:hypothetical protein